MPFSIHKPIRKAIIGVLAPWAIRFWIWTLRVRIEGDRSRLTEAVIGFWHGDLFAAVGIMGRLLSGFEKTCLISSSSDGQLLAVVLRKIGFQVVQGSSSSGGFKAALQLSRSTQGAILICPDGPRGPVHVAKRGIISIAVNSNKPLVLVVMRYTYTWTLGSWDRGQFPIPFSKCTFRIISTDPTTTQHIEEILNDR